MRKKKNTQPRQKKVRLAFGSSKFVKEDTPEGSVDTVESVGSGDSVDSVESTADNVGRGEDIPRTEILERVTLIPDVKDMHTYPLDIINDGTGDNLETEAGSEDKESMDSVDSVAVLDTVNTTTLTKTEENAGLVDEDGTGEEDEVRESVGITENVEQETVEESVENGPRYPGDSGDVVVDVKLELGNISEMTEDLLSFNDPLSPLAVSYFGVFRLRVQILAYMIDSAIVNDWVTPDELSTLSEMLNEMDSQVSDHFEVIIK